MKIKMLVNIEATKPDTYGNTYRAGQIVNPRNGEFSDWFKVSSVGNVAAMVERLTGINTGQEVMFSESCTGSARLSSIPKNEYMRKEDFAKALRSIGYRVTIARVKGCTGCL